jgi:hypothetical protein
MVAVTTEAAWHLVTTNAGIARLQHRAPHRAAEIAAANAQAVQKS